MTGSELCKNENVRDCYIACVIMCVSTRISAFRRIPGSLWEPPRASEQALRVPSLLAASKGL